MQMIDDDDWEADQIFVLLANSDNIDEEDDDNVDDCDGNNEDDNEDEADQIFVLHAASDEFVFGQTAVTCFGMLMTYTLLLCYGRLLNTTFRIMSVKGNSSPLGLTNQFFAWNESIQFNLSKQVLEWASSPVNRENPQRSNWSSPYKRSI